MQQPGLMLLQLEPEDHRLIEAAKGALRRNYRPHRHTVAAAVLCASGRIHSGTGVEDCLYGPCAEPRAIAAAFAQGDRDILAIVAVCRRGDEYPVVAPCEECCQLFADRAPEAMVILNFDGEVLKTQARNLLSGVCTSDLGDTRSVRHGGEA